MNYLITKIEKEVSFYEKINCCRVSRADADVLRQE